MFLHFIPVGKTMATVDSDKVCMYNVTLKKIYRLSSKSLYVNQNRFTKMCNYSIKDRKNKSVKHKLRQQIEKHTQKKSHT